MEVMNIFSSQPVAAMTGRVRQGWIGIYQILADSGTFFIREN
jgi:hypothetical protein